MVKNMNTLKENKTLFIYIILFLIISSISIYSASMYLSPLLGKLYIKQVFWYIIGIVIIMLISKISIKDIYKSSYIIYIINILFLILLLFVAPPINGSKSWFTIGKISIQPSEFMKISLILINAEIINSFYKSGKKISFLKELKLVLTHLLVLAIPSILTFLEPDTGSVIIYCIITFTMLFVSGIDKKWFIFFFFILILGFSSFLYIYLYKENLFIDIFGSNFFYRMDRIINWNMKSGMQLNNSLISIGSSGIIGHGFNKAPIYFPEAGTDFIFSIYASNFGLIGIIIFITLIMIFDLYLLKIAKNVTVNKYKYTIIGILSMIFFCQVQNISMTVGLLPITGITLPFISYGGSSILSYMILLGIIVNIKEDEKKKKAYK